MKYKYIVVYCYKDVGVIDDDYKTYTEAKKGIDNVGSHRVKYMIYKREV